MFPSLKVKDAIVDRILQKTGKRPNSGPDRHRLVFQLFWKKDRCWLYLNTSGRKISDRSYRKMPHKAPLRESLAAGIILATEYDGQQSFVAPMCGSGTLPIEAALIAQKRAPGLLRSSFGFMYCKDFDEKNWQELRAQARRQSQKSATPARIIASDIDENAIKAAKKNAITAGVDHLIEFTVCDFAETPVPQQKGIIVLNPEYGQRLGEISQLEETYKRIGDFFKQRCAGYTGYIFTGNMELAKKVGLRTSRRIPFYNAEIECRLLKYDLYEGSKKSV
jgi:putative N6-adenine-specific DNA methylase